MTVCEAHRSRCKAYHHVSRKDRDFRSVASIFHTQAGMIATEIVTVGSPSASAFTISHLLSTLFAWSQPVFHNTQRTPITTPTVIGVDLKLRFPRPLFLTLALAGPATVLLYRNHRPSRLTPTTTTAMPKRLTFTSNSKSTSNSLPLPPASHIPSTFTDGLPLPKILVFDLDYTLWPFWVDTHVSSPVKPVSKDPTTNTAMIDRYGESFAFYREVPGILHAARQKGITMGLASRTHAPDLAEKMLRGIMVPVPVVPKSEIAEEDEIVVVEMEKDSKTGKEKPVKAWDYFTYREIYPGSKIRHFNKIQAATGKAARKGSSAASGAEPGSEGVAFADMIFFDDEGRNREVETQLGVTFVLVRDGVTRDEVDRGVRDWRRRWGIAAHGGSENGVAEKDLEDELDG